MPDSRAIYPNEMVSEWADLYQNQGYTLDQIAALYNVSKSTVRVRIRGQVAMQPAGRKRGGALDKQTYRFIRPLEPSSQKAK